MLSLRIYENGSVPKSPFYDIDKFGPNAKKCLVYAAKLCWIAAICYLFGSQYESALTSTFISLSQEDGDCRELPLSITGEFYADENGAWSSNTDFSTNRALYGANLNNMQFTSEDWTQAMDRIIERLEWNTRKSANRDFAFNVVLMSSWASKVKYSQSAKGGASGN